MSHDEHRLDLCMPRLVRKYKTCMFWAVEIAECDAAKTNPYLPPDKNAYEPFKELCRLDNFREMRKCMGTARTDEDE